MSKPAQPAKIAIAGGLRALRPLVESLAKKVGGPVIALTEEPASRLAAWLDSWEIEPTTMPLQRLDELLRMAREGDQAVGERLGQRTSLVIAPLATTDIEGLLATVLPANLEMATKTVELAWEVVCLQHHASQQQHQLDASARQIALHALEQRTLRDLASKESQHLVLGSLHAMSRAIDARDSYTQGHSERVARLAFELARILDLSEAACQEIYVAGILHDIGKIGIPDSVLLKNGALSESEFDVIRKHPEIGHQIIEQVGKLQFTLPGVLYHHERWDGKGYPHKLKGESIPLMARILAVADSFDAMTSSRPYRDAMPISQAIDIIHAGRNLQWDSAVVDCFEIWQTQRSWQIASAPVDGGSLIPQEPPYENITQAVFALH